MSGDSISAAPIECMHEDKKRQIRFARVDVSGSTVPKKNSTSKHGSPSASRIALPLIYSKVGIDEVRFQLVNGPLICPNVELVLSEEASVPAERCR